MHIIVNIYRIVLLYQFCYTIKLTINLMVHMSEGRSPRTKSIRPHVWALPVETSPTWAEALHSCYYVLQLHRNLL